MALLVQKFGGTSLGMVERIEAVAEKVASAHRKKNKVVVVVSAMSGETNRLVELACRIREVPGPRELDVVLATGEQVTIGLLCIALEKRNVPARSFTGAQVYAFTQESYSRIENGFR